jgi:hypothetical protein
MKGVILAAALACSPAAAERIGAPRGDPAQVAFREITLAPYPCPRVTEAARRADGSIVARCSNGRRYLLFRERGYDGTVVLGCQQAREILNLSCEGDGASERVDKPGELRVDVLAG